MRIRQHSSGAGVYVDGSDASVLCVGEDGVTVQNIIISSASGGNCIPRSLSYSPLLHGVVIKCNGGSVFALRAVWPHSLRCAWRVFVSKTESGFNWFQCKKNVIC